MDVEGGRGCQRKISKMDTCLCEYYDLSFEFVSHSEDKSGDTLPVVFAQFFNNFVVKIGHSHIIKSSFDVEGEED